MFEVEGGGGKQGAHDKRGRQDSDLQYIWDCPEFCRVLGDGGVV